MDGVASAIRTGQDELIDTRRWIHRHPELSYEERATAALVAERCRGLGFAVREGVAATGVVADLDGCRPGPTVLLRADMDALPLSERGDDGRPAVSEVEGVMHACGHDGHVAIALAAAAVLSGMRERWGGRLRLCFQPAEEVADGARRMIADGALEGVDRILGLHLWTPLAAGRVAVTAGTIFGSADEFGIVVRGRGGHGGMPHTSIDPVVCASQIVMALQTIVSRETSPFSPAVVTVGRIEGGSAFNIIADEVRLRGTVRAVEQVERERLLRRIEEVATGVAASAGAEASVERGRGCPPVVNDRSVAAVVWRAACRAVGDGNVEEAATVTVGDDVACLLARVPGCFFLVGAGRPDGGSAPHHHPRFDIDEGCLPVGVEILSRATLELLGGEVDAGPSRAGGVDGERSAGGGRAPRREPEDLLR